MTLRRMLPFVLVNILVSSAVVLGLLYWWDNRDGATAAPPQALATPGSELSVAPAAQAPPPAATPTEPLPGFEPAPEGMTIHVVQPGDTLGGISERYDVPLADIMTANGLANPNLLSIGQQLLIPIGGLPTATPVPTVEPTEETPPTPIPTVPLDVGEVVVEITNVLTPGDLASESVTITNLGNRPVALAGWQLQSPDGVAYTFGQITLFGDGAAILVHSAAGDNATSDLYWGQDAAVWASGDAVVLLDAEGTERARFTVP